MKKHVAILLVLLICIFSNVNAFAFENNDFLPSGLAYTDIEKTIESYIRNHNDNMAAVSVAVFTGDKVLLEKAYGFIDIENNVPNNDDAVFEWGSCTKLLTWASVMQLSERGLIDLNADIRTYLPAGFLKKLRYDEPITMLSLMNHNAGWQETATDLWIENKEDIKDLGKALQQLEPEQINRPGEVVAYSNWGTALAGYIVERISGQTLSQYVRENIFKPLGMEHTALSPDLSDNKWVSEKRDELKCYTSSKRPLGTSRYYLSLYPAGSATGTLSDFVKFAQAFIPSGGKASLLFKNTGTLEKMLSPSLFYADGRTARNYHGFWADQFGVPVIWHNGGSIGSSSWFAFDPASGTGMVIFANQRQEAVFNCGLLPLVFGKYEAKQVLQQSMDISGVYVSERSCFTGYTKLQSLFNIIELKRDGRSGYFIPGPGFTVTDMGSNTFLEDKGGLKQDVIFAYTSSDGRNVLQMPGVDYVQENGKGVIARYLVLLVFIVMAVFSFIALLIDLIGLIIHKKLSKAGILRLCTNVSVVLAALLFAYVAVTLFVSYTAMFKSIQWSLIIIVILALIPIASTVILFVKWRSVKCTGWGRVWLFASVLAGITMTFNVIFWEVYRFW